MKEKVFSKKIGVFLLGAENVALYMNGASGGSFSLAPQDGSQPFIRVGHEAHMEARALLTPAKTKSKKKA